MKIIPDVIYLQWFSEDGEEADEVTWCVDRIYDTDTVYRIERSGPTPLAPDAEQQQALGDEETGAGEACRRPPIAVEERYV